MGKSIKSIPIDTKLCSRWENAWQRYTRELSKISNKRQYTCVTNAFARHIRNDVK